ncbi:hypothetical protein [Candidatus Entotheonella palauensis]|uniref:Uncharacterized protein n=1 Tax=Candidatus Entotheonella gemina TaxID=1429439 RepID=W4M8Q9_9BACT|nr:hypothetical protein [Candidatus Entotheonella palauensis]ETX06281.1 MAG: hypothetical protein ETSY2_18070 [Candidatus Entotheonella gemina]
MGIRSRQWYPNGLLSLLGMMLLGFGMMTSGCAHVKPFEPPRVDEIPEGPGLFTGSKGAFILSREIGGTAPAKPVPDEAQGVEPSATPDVPGNPRRKTPPL